jgi:hypothetical protein
MVRRVFVIGLGLAACHGKTASAPPIENKPPAAAEIDYGATDLVAFDGSLAVFYALGDRGVEELYRADQVDAVDDAGWHGRDQLVVFAAEEFVAIATTTGWRNVELPTLPRAVEGGESSNRLSVDDSGAWYGVCSGGGWGGDEYECDRWIWTRVVPPGERAEGDRPASPWTWPTAAPAGYQVTETPGDNYLASLGCAGADGSTTILPAEGESMIMEHHWVSVDPPALLVVSGHYGEDRAYPAVWELRDGCAATPRARGTFVEPGPAGLWVGRDYSDADSATHSVVYRGATAVGPVPVGYLIRFRPPRR